MSAMALDFSAVSYESGRRALQLAVDGDSSSIREIASLVAEETEDYRNSSSVNRDYYSYYVSCGQPLSCDHHTALEVAASAGHIGAVERLLEAGADPNAPVHEPGPSVLQAAAAQGQLIVVQKLLETGAQPDHCGKHSNATPLMAAAMGGHEVICKTLLQNGADVSISKWPWRDPAVEPVQPSAIEVAGESSNLTLLELFLLPVEHAAKEFDPEDLRLAMAEGRQKDSERLLRTKTFLHDVQGPMNRALVAAGRSGNIPVLQRLLDAGANISTAAFPDGNAIAAAASGGHLEAMTKLLQFASDQNMLTVEAVTAALQSAMAVGDLALLEPLLQAGADATEIDIRQAAACGHLDAMTFMLNSGARIDNSSPKVWVRVHSISNEVWFASRDLWNFTPLQLAAHQGHLAVVDLLLANGVDVNASVDNRVVMAKAPGATALQLAAAGGHLAVTKRLLDAGADVNAGQGDRNADNALQAAVRAGDTTMVELLLAAGADVEAVAPRNLRHPGRFPLRDRTALSIAAEVNNSELVARLLSMMSPENARLTAPLALREAVENHHTDIVRQLVQVHPDVNLSESMAVTLLQAAAANGDLEILKILLSEGADVNLDPTEGWQQTPLQYASERGDLAAVKLLLAAGAEVNVTGSTAPPLLLAVRGGHIQVSEHLLVAGADIHATAYRGQTMLEAAEQSRDAEIEDRVRAALDSRPPPPPPPIDQPLARGTGPLCETCRVVPLADLFGDGDEDGSGNQLDIVLHPSLTALKASAAAGCPLCCFIWKRLGITSISLPQPSPVKFQVKRWNHTVTFYVTEPFPDGDRPERLAIELAYNLSIPGQVSARTELSRVPITEDTSSSETYQQINSWLDNCKHEHPKCRELFGNRTLPTRLIYLETLGDSSSPNPVDTSLQPRLVSTNSMECSECRYLALSYRWPQDLPVEAKATRNNIQQQMRGLDTSKLPQIFNDVFQVAAGTGVSFVWIDALCIVQDDPEDWNREAALMIQIYRHAEFTVAAAAPFQPTNPDLGLFRHGDPSDVLSVRLTGLEGPRQYGLGQDLVLMKTQEEAYQDSPLIYRGWCFQEREISPRIVHYTETQVLWECHTVQASEGLPDGFGAERGWTGRIFDNELNGDIYIEGVWQQAVDDYSARNLTVFTDKLPALAGLAAAIHGYKPANCRYLAGLWEDSFLEGLQWSSSSSVRYTRTVPNTRYPEYIAPTWSWASVAGPISYWEAATSYNPECHVYSADYALKVVDIHVQTSTSDPYGAVKHAVLTCTAGLVPGVLWEVRGCACDFEVRTVDGDRVADMDFDIEQERCDGEGVTVVFCIFIDEPPQMGLAIVPTGYRKNEYRRVGLITGIDEAYFEDAEIKEITII